MIDTAWFEDSESIVDGGGRKILTEQIFEGVGCRRLSM